MRGPCSKHSTLLVCALALRAPLNLTETGLELSLCGRLWWTEEQTFKPASLRNLTFSTEHETATLVLIHFQILDHDKKDEKKPSESGVKEETALAGESGQVSRHLSRALNSRSLGLAGGSSTFQAEGVV